ncbi:hypothetical protein ACLMPM_22700 [Yersinia enterocolitica]|uniref:hypothetical protein n=1 Tax=Yersinia enterocolitica TaxID=630 RepID=UPI00398D00B5
MTEEIKTGGPAFPVDDIILRDEKGHLHGHIISSTGLTIRDYMAIKYMQGVSANPEKLYDNDDLAKEAYQMADAMIKARG